MPPVAKTLAALAGAGFVVTLALVRPWSRGPAPPATEPGAPAAYAEC